MNTPLSRTLSLVGLLLVTSLACAQGPGRHGAGWSGAQGRGGGHSGLAYGAGYQARRLQQAECEGRAQAPTVPPADQERAPATSPSAEPPRRAACAAASR